MTHDLVPNSEPLTVYVVAGPNGAGKTTFATEFLPGFVHCREFLNSDLIAPVISPLGLLRDLRQQGYRVVLFFLWLRSAELAIRGTCGTASCDAKVAGRSWSARGRRS